MANLRLEAGNQKLSRICIQLFALFLMLYSNLSAQKQFTADYRGTIGITPVRFDNFIATFNNVKDFKYIPGVFYHKEFRNSNWGCNFNIKYTNQNIDDQCMTCFDSPVGNGRYKEFSFDIGLRFTMRKLPLSWIEPFLEVGPFYTHIEYSGLLSGGFNPDLLMFDKVYDIIGIHANLGIVLYPRDRLPVILKTGIMHGWGIIRKHSNNEIFNTSFDSRNFLEIQIGYTF